MTDPSEVAVQQTDPGEPWLCLLVATDDEEIEGHALALRSQGIHHGVRSAPRHHELWIPAASEAKAREILRRQAEDAAEGPAEPPPAPDRGFSSAGILTAVALLALFWVTGERGGVDRAGWFRAGSAVAEAISAGQWWRAGTALTLHADPAHVGGNMVAAIIFVGALGRWMGGGAAAFATLVIGTLGNLIVAVAYQKAHNSVGASTATFGALGLLAGLQIRRWFSGHHSVSAYFRRRRALSVFGACLGFFAMVGVGETSDVAAHAAGMGTGLLAGLAFAPWAGRAPSRFGFVLQGLLGVLTMAATGGLWWLARRAG